MPRRARTALPAARRSPRPGRAPPDASRACRSRGPARPSSSTRPASADYEARPRADAPATPPRRSAQRRPAGHRRRPRLRARAGTPPPSGDPVVALDGALAMVRRTREVAPDALGVQADLLALPFRRGALAAGVGPQHLRPPARRRTSRWRSATCTDRSRRTRPSSSPCSGATDEGRGVFPDDDFPGRWFSTWTDERLRDVVARRRVRARRARGAARRRGRPGLPSCA